jgi:hypothetical protein
MAELELSFTMIRRFDKRQFGSIQLLDADTSVSELLRSNIDAIIQYYADMTVGY